MKENVIAQFCYLCCLKAVSAAIQNGNIVFNTKLDIFAISSVKESASWLISTNQQKHLFKLTIYTEM